MTLEAAAQVVDSQEEKPEDGDVYDSHTGVHIGSIETKDLILTRHALHLQVYFRGEWFVYQLVGIEKLGEENAEPAQG